LLVKETQGDRLNHIKFNRKMPVRSNPSAVANMTTFNGTSG